jgi:Leucine-rich repeat (LRR) protein
MELSLLKNQLLADFSIENLTYISSRLIGFHKNRHLKALQKTGEVVSRFYPFSESSDARLFSRLIVLFHPDKLNDYHNQINRCKDQESLQVYRYLAAVREQIDLFNDHSENALLDLEAFEEEYGWNYRPSDDDYYLLHEEEEPQSPWFDEENIDDRYFFSEGQGTPDGSFLTALKRKIYGPVHFDFPVHLLEDLEEIEMAEYEIEDLDGIEFCTYAKVIDLSYNQLFDVSKIASCSYTQELYLANNQLRYIDALAQLQDLRMLDLSGNKINDASPLFFLQALEFVNLMGNPIPLPQILELKKRGVTVVY